MAQSPDEYWIGMSIPLTHFALEGRRKTLSSTAYKDDVRMMIETLETVQPAKTIRLVLGDQLNLSHSWFQEQDDSILYVLAEMPSETDYVRHHVQKICAFFQAMKEFAAALCKQGHRVCWLTLDQTADYPRFDLLLPHLQGLTGAQALHYQMPDEYRLKQEFEDGFESLGMEVRRVETEHFFLSIEEFDRYFKPGQHNRMESFYRAMRKRTGILMEDDHPIGGQWNYDKENRNKLSAKATQSIPRPLMFANDVSEILARLDRHNIQTMGKADSSLLWPVNLDQARSLLRHFLESCLALFGTYQDSMTELSEHAWSLYHSRVSFALNAKILSPHEVIDSAIDHYHAHQDHVSIAQIEGFVRQILGWREYVRGIYWVNMPDYHEQNYFASDREVPSWFWTGETDMACLRSSIGQSLEFAYAHHIQRLMVIGNFALLAGLSPDQVDEWYLGVYVDALEWVELPNTRGMALFADGGWIATKPYAASGNYINKMSDHCKGCRYQVKTKTDEDSCPLNSLYWHFMGRNLHLFENNPRMAFPMKHWQRLSNQEQNDLMAKAQSLLNNLENL